MSKATPVMVPPPVSAVSILLIANVVVYFLTANSGLSGAAPGPVLLAKGALFTGAFAPAERWRLLAAAFLHLNPAHLAVNMFSLVMLGPPLERRIGATNFFAIYFVAAITGSVCSVAFHRVAFIGVGASGAIFGLLGALVGAWLFGSTEISPMFFVVNLAINIAFAATSPGIDYFAHAGGFAGGLIGYVALEAVARANHLWLRCLFPEFVKLTLCIIFLAAAVLVAFGPPVIKAGPIATGVSAVAITVIATKLVDLTLSIRKGLALVAVALAAAIGGASYLLLIAFPAALSGACQRLATLFPSSREYCYPMTAEPAALATAIAFLMVLILLPQIARGVADRGFVGASFVGERRRRAGALKRSAY